MCLKEIWCNHVDYIQLAHDTALWQGLVNMVINLLILKTGENFFISEARASQDRLCSIKLVT